MALTQDQEDQDYRLRVTQVETNIEKLRNDMRYESRKFALQTAVAAAALVAAGVAIGNFFHIAAPPPPPPPPQIIFIPQSAPPAPSPGHS